MLSVNTYVVGLKHLDQMLLAAVERLFATHTVSGRAEASTNLDAFNQECDAVIPRWYLELLQRFLLCGVELEWTDPEAVDNVTGLE
jgi:hypothetical protein